ncbi:MAG: two-component system nitrogen regulation sensor histidine kinase NtrY [Marivirga sp.]|jgi:two-component system nitrogen regulation sensor histidine kinase NtrY
MKLFKLYSFSIIALLIAVVFFRGYYHNLEIDADNFVDLTQHRLDERMQEMLTDEQIVLDYLRVNKEFNFKSLAMLRTKYPFFIYKSGQLVFWSDEVVLEEVKIDSESRWQFYNETAGQYLLLANTSKDKDVTLIFVNSLYTNYEINNEYISPFYNPEIFSQEDLFLLSDNRLESYKMTDFEGNALFFLKLAEGFRHHQFSFLSGIIIVEFLLLCLLILSLWNLSTSLISSSKHWLGLFIMFVGLLLLRILMWLFHFPFQSSEIELFDPKYFASSALNPSFGALLINCFLLFVFASFIISILLKITIDWKGSYHRYKSVIASFVSYSLFLLIYGFIESIYRHSQWGMDIFNTINADKFIALSLFTFLVFAVFLYFIVNWLHRYIRCHVKDSRKFLIDQLLSLGLFIVFCWLIKAPFLWVSIVVTVLNSLVYFLKLSKINSQLSFVNFIYLFLIVAGVSAVAAWSSYHMEALKRNDDQNRFANRILNDNDVLGEYLLTQMHTSLLTDKQIQFQFLLPITPYSAVANKIEKYYLSDYFEKYEKEVTIYDSQGNALFPIKAPKFKEYMNQTSLSEANLRSGDFLYLVRNTDAADKSKKYVYLFDVVWSDYVLATICVTLSPKKVQPDNVFPELLVDKRFIPDVQEVPYNYALYQNDTLSYTVGGTKFPEYLVKSQKETYLSDYVEQYNEDSFYLTTVENQGESVVFAAHKENLISLFSKFSYFFIVCFSIVVLFSLYYFLRAYFQDITIGLSAKIQLFFSLAFLIPLISISVSTISFVNATFLQDIVKSYQERIHRVGDHLTTMMIQYEAGKINKEDLAAELLNTTKIVNSDLNIYNLNGKRILTSQPQIFEKNLLSDYVNPEAYVAIKFDNKQLFTLEESIGRLEYKTAYNAIYSYNTGNLLAILSSPFFKSSKEYDALLANLLTNVFNIFVASFMVFMLLAYGATRILTKPLSLLQGKLAEVNLSEANEPLNWPVDDEIGLLITEYNQMLLKLERSRQALSRTEKESAWREMAQQVAHEIKNPLTPMKLSLQHLLMRIDNGEGATPEASAKIKSILSQVDNLSDIATSFSSFAKMPIPENARTNVKDVLLKVVSLFKLNEQNIALKIPLEEIFAFVDPKLIERIFNNILINALQSEAAERAMIIQVSMQVLDKKVMINFQDNGAGISEENLHKIFLPNFTTKEEGSGIGLALAKRGIEYAGGKIWVESEIGVGSNFYIELKRNL